MSVNKVEEIGNNNDEIEWPSDENSGENPPMKLDAFRFFDFLRPSKFYYFLNICSTLKKILFTSQPRR